MHPTRTGGGRFDGWEGKKLPLCSARLGWEAWDMARTLLVDPSRIDPTNVLADIEHIRRFNRQRYEFEQLSHICLADEETGEVAGVLDIPEDVWWGRGHVPERALMPGVLMIECAAQVCSWMVYQVTQHQDHKGRIFGFGGIDSVKFRASFSPPARFVVVGKKVEVRSRRAVFDTQGFLADDLNKCVFEARITGMWV